MMSMISAALLLCCAAAASTVKFPDVSDLSAYNRNRMTGLCNMMIQKDMLISSHHRQVHFFGLGESKANFY
jgi:hypothetical protein